MCIKKLGYCTFKYVNKIVLKLNNSKAKGFINQGVNVKYYVSVIKSFYLRKLLELC